MNLYVMYVYICVFENNSKQIALLNKKLRGKTGFEITFSMPIFV